MICPKCSASLEDDSKFCVSCGASIEINDESKNESEACVAEASGDVPSLEQTEHTKEQAGATNTASSLANIIKNRRELCGLIVGTVLIIIGLTRILSAGTTISSTSFGADFYTYTYQGIVAISEILTSVEGTLGGVIVAIGAAIDVSSQKR